MTSLLICYLHYSAMAGMDRLWIVAVHLFLMSASLLITGKYMYYVCIHVRMWLRTGKWTGAVEWKMEWIVWNLEHFFNGTTHGSAVWLFTYTHTH